MKLSPSMMCADLFSLGETLKTFDACGVEYLHMDIMDGAFVPNFTLGTDYCKRVRKVSSIPQDLHLMIERVDEKLGFFDIRPGDIVSVHAEATVHLQRVLNAIREKGAHPYVAINPATPLSVLQYVLDDIDGVLVMTVNPGFAGQKLIPATLGKIADLRRWLDETGHGAVEIEVDGNVSFENAVKMKNAGASIFVGGTSSVFSPAAGVSENIAKFRAALG